MVSPWHLPEYLHQTNWTVREMSKFIARRDPRKPGFWYMSFSPPHPPLAPLPSYLDMYRDIEIDEPFYGDWSEDPTGWPYALRARPVGRDTYSPGGTETSQAGLLRAGNPSSTTRSGWSSGCSARRTCWTTP